MPCSPSSPEVEVAAAVLLRGDAFLLACRPQGKACAGDWEFPGGKVEAGESVRDALVRELREELGITVIRATPWLTRRHVYSHARVRVHFWRVTEWIGEIDVAAPLEHSAVAWQPLYGPSSVAPMLAANAPILKALSLPPVMAVTHAEAQGFAAERNRLRAGFQEGKLCVRIRDHGLSPTARTQWAREVATLAEPTGSLVFVSEDGSGGGIRMAREMRLSGAHLTSWALARCKTRPELPWVGASCHTAKELEQAERLELDYALLGPVLPTPSHPGAPGLGWESFSGLVKNVSLPVFALGGQTRTTLETAWQHGAHGIAALRGSLTA